MIDYTPWLFNGLLSSQTVPNNNMLSYTGQALTLLEASGQELTPIYSEMRTAIYACSPHPGTLSRHENSLEDTSIDDYLSVATALPEMAIEMQDRALKHLGFLSVFGFGPLKQCFLRFPAFFVHCTYSCGFQPSWLGQLIWSISLIISARSPITKQDSWMQSHLMIIAYKRSKQLTPICNAAVDYWKSKKTKTMREIVKDYLNLPSHPLIDLWDDFYL